MDPLDSFLFRLFMLLTVTSPGTVIALLLLT